jgi:3-oxoisoapionate decarboxylase
MMRLGISSWAYGWAVGVDGYPQSAQPLAALDLLQRACQLGVDLAQIGDNLPVHQLPSLQLASIREVACDLGIAIELGTRGVQPAHLLRYLDLAVYFEAKLVRTLPQEITSQPSPPEAEEWIGSVMEHFRAAGVVLALENYERQTSVELAALVQRIADPFLGVCLDTVNSIGALETPKEVVRNLMPYIRNLHVKDFIIRRPEHKMGYEISGCPVGEGMLNVDWLFTELRAHGADPTVILEQWAPWEGSIAKTIATEKEWAARSIIFLGQYR